MRRIIITVAIAAATAGAASAQYIQPYNGGYGTGSNPNGVQHQGYTTNQGTYVQPHMQSAPNNTQLDNYGTRGNTNPFTGQIGTRSPYR